MPEKITNLSDQGVGAYPLERPLGLLHDFEDGEDVEALHLTVDALHHYPEAIEASRLWNQNLYNETIIMMMLGINL